MIANIWSARGQSLIGIVHFFAMLRKARYKSLKTASSFGNSERFLMIFRKP